MYSESKRIEYFDSIRGLAALFVLLYHIFGGFTWPGSYSAFVHLPFVSILFNGSEAVCMFFVLSGYVLSKPYVPSMGNPNPRPMYLPTFYLRRLTRIWVPWFFFFLSSIVARRYFFYESASDPPTTEWLKQFWRASLGWRDYAKQCLFLTHDGSRQLLNQDWSLAVELKASLLMPLFVFLLRHRWLSICVAVTGVYPVFAGAGHDYFFYISFLFGVLLARHGESIAVGFRQNRWEAKVLVLMAGLVLYQTLGWVLPFCHGTSPLFRLGWTGTGVGCVLILLSALSSEPLQRLLNWKPLVFLGRISYSVYLVQFIVILCLLPPVVHGLNERGVHNRLAILALILITGVGVAIGLSAIAYPLVEEPSVRLGHELTKRIQNRWRRGSAR